LVLSHVSAAILRSRVGGGTTEKRRTNVQDKAGTSLQPTPFSVGRAIARRTLWKEEVGTEWWNNTE